MRRGLWSRHPRLVVAFVLALGLSLFFAGRITFGLIYWSAHREVQIEPWMTVRYVGRSWGLDARDIILRAGLPLPERGTPLTLEDLARQNGVPVADMVALITATVATMKADTGAAPDGTPSEGGE